MKHIIHNFVESGSPDPTADYYFCSYCLEPASPEEAEEYNKNILRKEVEDHATDN